MLPVSPLLSQVLSGRGDGLSRFPWRFSTQLGVADGAVRKATRRHRRAMKSD